MTHFEDTIHLFILLDNNICKRLYDLLGVFKNIILFEPHIYANLEQGGNLTLILRIGKWSPQRSKQLVHSPQ